MTRDQRDRDFDRELQSWIDELAERYEAGGAPPDDARRRALAETGGVVAVKEAVRDQWAGAALDALLLDARYAWRGLRKARGLTAVIVLTLALGIGANTAIFSVVHAMLLRPLPYRDADRLAFIWLDRTQAGYPRGPMSGPDFKDLRERSRTFADFGGIWSTNAVAFVSSGDSEPIRSGLVTTNFFQVLGAEAAIGRTFRPEDSARGADPTILIGWDLFQRRFGGDPSIVGQRIRVDNASPKVIGVMPESFRLLLPADASVPDGLQAWTPFWPDLESGPRRNLFLRVVGRMRPGVTLAAARDDIAEVGRRVSREIGSTRSFTTVGLQDDDVREIRGALLALFAGVAILLMIACVNVASLLVARAASRARETALRLALGASRGRLLRQFLVEGLALAAAGAAAGVFAGWAGLRALVALAPASLARLSSSRIDATVLAFTGGLSLAWGLLFSLAPLTELMKADPAHTLQWNLRTTAASVRYRVRAALVVAQVALSVVLLVGAGLLVRAFVEVVRVDPGFRADRELTFRMSMPDGNETEDAFNIRANELRRRMAAVAGVTGVGAFSHLPYDDMPNWGLPFSLTTPIPPDATMADARAISPGLFETVGASLMDGRPFTEADRDGRAPVVIVDDMLARQLWPDGGAVGRHFFVNIGSKDVTVVGVVRHLRVRSLVENLSPQIFVPWAIAQRNPIAWVVRTDGDPASYASAIRTAIAGVDPRLAIYDVRPMTGYVEAARATRRFTMLLAALFAACALALTLVGVYGVLAYAVAHRRHEFGVRRALGADAAQVLREVMREGLGFALLGGAVGLAAAVMAARLLQNQLYGVPPHDPITFAAAVLVLLLGSVVACWIPAYRATMVSPMDALRTE